MIKTPEYFYRNEVSCEDLQDLWELLYVRARMIAIFFLLVENGILMGNNEA